MNGSAPLHVLLRQVTSRQLKFKWDKWQYNFWPNFAWRTPWRQPVPDGNRFSYTLSGHAIDSESLEPEVCWISHCGWGFCWTCWWQMMFGGHLWLVGGDVLFKSCLEFWVVVVRKVFSEVFKRKRNFPKIFILLKRASWYYLFLRFFKGIKENLLHFNWNGIKIMTKLKVRRKYLKIKLILYKINVS